MNVFSVVKPLHTSVVFIIMKLYMLERNCVNYSNVISLYAMGSNEVQYNSNIRRMQMINYFNQVSTDKSVPEKYTPKHN